MSKVCIGIDASNIRSGGGLTHLSELLRAAELAASSFGHVIVWAGKRTLESLPNKEWLELVHEPIIT